ncbi:hypothetical protein EYC59_05225 [Candidatus Saccharibacteria bacterium]|nr:MAG: hypothetical protein EYC59_05225 [Candidatus Saccharibacteria bacterium]
MPDKVLLEELYQVKQLSIAKIASELGMSPRLVSSALKSYGITLRTQAETSYLQHRKVFKIKTNLTTDELVLYGVGLGLYWGEGNKTDPYSVRLGNTDPALIITFVRFLRVICGVKESDIRFGLQLFNDSEAEVAVRFWMDVLQCDRGAFHKTISAIPPQGKGTYQNKNKHGVLQVYVSNKRLKEWIMAEVKKVPR